MQETAKSYSSMELSAVITRADGTVINLGKLEADYRHPVRQFVWRHIQLPLKNRKIRRISKWQPS